MTGFDTFENRWEITSTLTLESALHIGGGLNAAAYSLSDGAVLQQEEKDGVVQPYIPGSSLKGILRGTLERLVQTFHPGSCNLSFGRRAGKPCGLEDCITCHIFGSLKGGSRITVRDARLTPESAKAHRALPLVADQPHCATQYSKNLVANENKDGTIATRLWLHERVAAGTQFTLSIALDNADETDVGFVLLALDEFNQKRATIGGGTSRGLGFISIDFPPKITRTCIKKAGSFEVLTEEKTAAQLILAAKKALAGKPVNNTVGDFSAYAHAFDPVPDTGEIPAGCVVTELKIHTVTPFRMPGSEEMTVTCNGEPYIPGSTIKGFLRHRFIGIKNHHPEQGITPEWIYRIFGAANDYGDNDNRRKAHRSRLLVSDAFPEKVTGNSDEIPQGTDLKLWVLFDNLECEDIARVLGELLVDRGIRITGSTIAKGASTADEVKTIKVPRFNMVKISAVTLNPFRADSYLKNSSAAISLIDTVESRVG